MGTSYILTLSVPPAIPRSLVEWHAAEIASRSLHIVNLGLLHPALQQPDDDYVMRFRVYAFGIVEFLSILAEVMRGMERTYLSTSGAHPGIVREMLVLNEESIYGEAGTIPHDEPITLHIVEPELKGPEERV